MSRASSRGRAPGAQSSRADGNSSKRKKTRTTSTQREAAFRARRRQAEQAQQATVSGWRSQGSGRAAGIMSEANQATGRGRRR